MVLPAKEMIVSFPPCDLVDVTTRIGFPPARGPEHHDQRGGDSVVPVGGRLEGHHVEEPLDRLAPVGDVGGTADVEELTAEPGVVVSTLGQAEVGRQVHWPVGDLIDRPELLQE